MAKFAEVQIDIEPTEKTREFVRSIVREELRNIVTALKHDMYGAGEEKPAEQKPEAKEHEKEPYYSSSEIKNTLESIRAGLHELYYPDGMHLLPQYDAQDSVLVVVAQHFGLVLDWDWTRRKNR